MEKQKREISLEQIFWRVLFGWRILVICAVVFAVLFGGGFYAKSLRAYHAASEPQEAEETVFTADEQTQIDRAVSISRLLNQNQEYMNSSVLMNLDPYREHVLTLQYYVNSDYTFNYTQDNFRDYTDAVAEAYCGCLESEELIQRLSEVLGCDTEYVRELIGTDSLGMDESAEKVSGTGLFEIQVVYSDDSVLEQAAEIIDSEIANQTETISQNIGSHSVVLLSKNITVTADIALADRQKAVQDKITSYTTTLESLQEDLSDEQLAAMEEEESEEEQVETQEVAKPQLSVKYMGLGAIVGIVLAAFFIAQKVFLAGELQEANEVTEYYHLQLLGTIDISEKKRKNVIDKLLQKIRYRNRELLSAEKSLDIIEANIELTCKTENITRLHIISSLSEALQGDVWEKLKEKLQAAGIEATYGSRICYEPQLLREMTEAGNVVIVEQLEKSVLSEIEREVMLMNDHSLRILGGIVVEAV